MINCLTLILEHNLKLKPEIINGTSAPDDEESLSSSSDETKHPIKEEGLTDEEKTAGGKCTPNLDIQ